MSEDRARLLSPRGLLLHAGLLTALWLLCRAAGLDGQMGFLAGGTVAEPLAGLTFLVVHFLFLLAAPVLALGALIFTGLSWLTGRWSTPSP